MRLREGELRRAVRVLLRQRRGMYSFIRTEDNHRLCAIMRMQQAEWSQLMKEIRDAHSSKEAV